MVQSYPRWESFNIAANHNEHYSGTAQAFSAATVLGTGGGDETTGYMGVVSFACLWNKHCLDGV